LGDVGIPETQHRDASLIQPTVALFIFRLVVGVCVLTAIELNREPQSRAIEIENELTGGMLPSEICAKLAVT
jgi:hypothetical protein